MKIRAERSYTHEESHEADAGGPPTAQQDMEKDVGRRLKDLRAERGQRGSSNCRYMVYGKNWRRRLIVYVLVNYQR